MPRPTLLVFSLGADAESRRCPLLPAAWRNDELALRHALFHATVDAGQRAGCRVRVSSPVRLAVEPATVGWHHQARGTFGERILGALGDIETQTEGPVVLVGTDVPGLDANSVGEALAALDAPDAVVLGPSPDGGFYLLAAARPVAPLLGAVRWCRRDTLRQVRRALHAAGRRVVLLAPLADLDSPADLDRWLHRASTRRFAAIVRVLRRRFAARRRVACFAAPSTRRVDRIRRRGRAPPASLLVA